MIRGPESLTDLSLQNAFTAFESLKKKEERAGTEEVPNGAQGQLPNQEPELPSQETSEPNS